MKLVIEIDEKQGTNLRAVCWKNVIDAMSKTLHETNSVGYMSVYMDLYDDELDSAEKKLGEKNCSKMRVGGMKFSNYKFKISPR